MHPCEKIHGMRRRTPAYLLLLAFTAILMTACERDDGAAAGVDSHDPPVLLKRGNGGDPQTLDPARAEDVHAFNVLLDLYEGLVMPGSNGDLVPGAATSWDISDDGLRYSFHLRANAVWSNGEPLTAADFRASLLRALAPETASTYSFLLHPISNIAAPDARTLILDLEVPAPHLLSVLAMPVAFPVWSGAASDDEQFSRPQHFVGNGPFVLDEWEPGHRIRLSKNNLFHAAKTVDIDTIEYYAIVDLQTELNMYRAGELDITASVPGGSFEDLRRNREDELHIAPSLGVYYLAFDLSENPLDDRALRQALTMAINRDALVEVIGRGEQPAYGLVPDGVTGYVPSRYGWSDLTPDERHAEARRIFAGSRFSAARPQKLKLTYDTGDIHEKVALAVSSMWRDVLGIDVELDKREWKYFLETRSRRDEWQVMRFAWTGDYNHASTFTDILQSTSPQNLAGYENSEYDEMLNAAAMADADAQSKLFASAEALMLNDYPIAPLYFFVSKHLVSPSVEGFNNNVLDQHPSRYLRVKPAPAQP